MDGYKTLQSSGEADHKKRRGEGEGMDSAGKRRSKRPYVGIVVESEDKPDEKRQSG